METSKQMIVSDTIKVYVVSLIIGLVGSMGSSALVVTVLLTKMEYVEAALVNAEITEKEVTINKIELARTLLRLESIESRLTYLERKF